MAPSSATDAIRLGYGILYGVLAVSAVGWWILRYRLFKRLEFLHPDTYASLGRPTLFWRSSMENNWNLFWFLMNSHYLNLEDEGTRRLCRLAKWMLWTQIGALLASVGLYVFMKSTCL